MLTAQAFAVSGRFQNSECPIASGECEFQMQGIFVYVKRSHDTR